jgi:hypothetical protein
MSINAENKGDRGISVGILRLVSYLRNLVFLQTCSGFRAVWVVSAWVREEIWGDESIYCTRLQWMQAGLARLPR